MKWPFTRKQSAPPMGTKSATFLFSAGSLQMMQHSYETFATEGYGLNPVVRGCVEKIATAMTSVDIQAYTKDKAGKLKEVPNHPVLTLLNKPNPAMTGEEFIGDLTRYFLIAGNGYVHGTGIDHAAVKPKPPKELYLYKPGCMGVVKGYGVLPQAYEYRLADGSKIIYPVNPITGMSAIMHKKTFNPVDQWTGLSPMTAAAFGIDIGNEGSKWNLRLLQNEGRPSGAMIVKKSDGTPQELSDEQYHRIREQINEQFTGSSNAGRPLLLEGGLEWQEMSMTAKDMDHEKNTNKAARDIALVYGVPPMLLGIPGDNKYANMEEARLALWTDTVLPLLKSMLGSLNNWLAPMYGDGVMLWYDEDMIPALEPLRKAKADRIEASSSLSINEKREAMGHDQTPGGDVILVDSSKVPLELVGDMGLVEPGSAAQQGE